MGEISRVYGFTSEQRSRYLASMDAIFSRAGHGELSPHVDDFLVPRIFWSAARMHDRPRLRSWRRARLDLALDTYLSGGSVAEMWLAPDAP